MNENLKKQDGFSIAELAIVLIIFGMIMSTIMLGYRYYLNSKINDDMEEAFNEVQTALFEFQLQQNRYPCPARSGLGPGDANYGIEDCGGSTTVVGTRDVLNNDGINENVLIGAVPIRTLLDPNNDGDLNDAPYPDFIEKHAFDVWGNKMTYVISEPLTDGLTFHQDNGVIDIIDENRNSVLETPGTAQAILISHGPNGKGAYTESGNLVENCAVGIQKQQDIDDGLATPPDETENCQYTDAVFMNGLRNDTSYNYYDDAMNVILQRKTTLWEYTNVVYDDKGTPDDFTDDVLINQVANTNGGNVGIGESDPTQKLHVEGEIQAFAVEAEAVCDQGGQDCMLPEAIAGELPDMQCPAGEVIVSIEENSVNCANPFTGSITGTCPPGQFLIGVSSTTGIICQ